MLELRPRQCEGERERESVRTSQLRVARRESSRELCPRRLSPGPEAHKDKGTQEGSAFNETFFLEGK